MNRRDKAELEAVLEYAKKVRDDPETEPAYAAILDRWIKRDEANLLEFISENDTLRK